MYLYRWLLLEQLAETSETYWWLLLNYLRSYMQFKCSNLILCYIQILKTSMYSVYDLLSIWYMDLHRAIKLRFLGDSSLVKLHHNTMHLFPYLGTSHLLILCYIHHLYILHICMYSDYFYITVESLFGIPHDRHFIYSYFPFIFSL